jgi:DNA-binding CsgD family transcriptional regulator
MRAVGNTISGGPLYSGAVIDLPREPRESLEAVRARMEAKTDWRARSPFGPRSERQEKAATYAAHEDPTYSEYAFAAPLPGEDEPDAGPAPATCSATAAGTGGQQHHCQLRPGHTGAHEDRFYRWDLARPANPTTAAESAPAALAADPTPQGAATAATPSAPPRPAGTTPAATAKPKRAPRATHVARATKPRRRSAPTPRPVTPPAPGAGPRTKPDAAGIVREYTEDGMTIPQIAAKRGHSHSTVRNLLKATPGVVMRDDRKTHSGGQNKAQDDPQLVDQVRRLYRAGATQQKIAWKLGTSPKVVQRIMRDHGIEARPPANVPGFGSSRPGTSTLRDLVTAIRDAGLTSRQLRGWAREHGIDVPTRGPVGWPVLNAYLAAHHLDGSATAATAEPLCEARRPDEPMLCTLPAGHAGAHVAHDGADVVIGTWPTAAAPPTRGSVRRRGARWRATCTLCGPIALDEHATALAALDTHLRSHRETDQEDA